MQEVRFKLMTTRIQEHELALKEGIFEQTIKPCRQSKNRLQKVNLSLAVVKPKDKRAIEPNILMEVDSHPSELIEEQEDFDNLVNYLQFAYDKYISPMYLHHGKIGDVVILDADVDEACFFEDDKLTISINISIPNTYKESWGTYIASRYGELSKFKKHLNALEFDIRDFKMQKVNFQFKFNMVEEETVKFINQNSEVDKKSIANWLALFNDVENKCADSKIHTKKLKAQLVETEFGPRLDIMQEKVKFKIGL